MANTTTTPNMNLILPIVGIEIGPDWASEINSAFNLIDTHDHTSAKGTRIPIAGISVNATLNMGDFGLSNVLNLGCKNNSVAISATTYKNSVYVAAGELYYNDNSGNQIKLTSAGGINLSSIGQIGGDYSTSTASVAYSTAGTTFTFTKDTGLYAKVNIGDLKVFEIVASGKYVEFKAPTSLAADYSLTLPAALPSIAGFLQCSTAGVLSFGNTINLTINSISDNYTLALTDSNKLIELTGSVAKTITIPPIGTIALPIGTQISMYQNGTGALSIAAGAGVTIRSELGLNLNAQYSMCAIVKVASDTWVLTGALKA